MTTPIFYIKSGSLSFADKTIFDELELYLYPKDKICFVGKNGSGKSSLLKVITGEYELDDGELYKGPNIQISYLKQEAEIKSGQKALDYILEGLDIEQNKYKAEMIASSLQIDPDSVVSNLSGGQQRRVSLARSLCLEPDILLLDEPTNHLDIKAIQWLEDYLATFPGCVVIISHDRRFLANVTNKIWWLDRGFLRKSNEGFKNFEKWQESVIEFEENQLRKLDKKLSEENLWMSQGVTARRKRNQKRLTSLKALRAQMQNFKSHVLGAKAKLSLDLEKTESKAKFIVEADNISFGHDNKPILNNFSLRIIRGEKIGIVGPNGSGKSTLIKLLTKTLTPSSGKVKHGATIDITYLDQQRIDLAENQTLAQFLCPQGGDTVFLKNREMHVAGYLKQFLFDPRMMHARISGLSGGERNRLLLAKALIKPGNFMILDEPTNDLDVDTLDLLLEILSDYDGTLLVVSHDRDFLDKLVLKNLVFVPHDSAEGQGQGSDIIEVYGGYEEYAPYLELNPGPVHKNNNSQNKKNTGQTQTQEDSSSQKNGAKLTYKDKFLLENLPKEIASLEIEISNIETEISDPALYQTNSAKFDKLVTILSAKQVLLEDKMSLWIEIEEKSKSAV